MADYDLGKATGTIRITYDDTGVTKAKKGLGDLDRAGGSTEESMSRVAMAMGVAGAALGAGLAVAGKVAIDFEKQISAIGAVSGATGGELELLRKKALQLGSDTAFSASEAGLAMEELVKAGLPIEAVLNGAADATVALAAAGAVSLPEAATIAANAMNTFGLAAKDLGHVADVIAGAANSSAIDVGEFAFSMSQAGAVANLVGLSFDDMATAIALMGNAGIKGSDAGTSLKTMLSNLQPVTKKQTDLFRELGILTEDGSNKFFDAQGNIKSLADVSQVLTDALGGMTAQQKSMALEMIFGSDAIRAAAVLTDAGAKGFNDMAAAIGKVSAEDVAAKRLDNVAGALEKLKGSAETAAITLGTTMLPAIKSVAEFLDRVATAFANFDKGTQQTIVTVVAIAGTLLLLAAAFIKIVQFVKAFQVAWAALNLSFLASPIGLIIIAVLALIAVIVLIATKTTWFQQIWEKIWGFLKAVGAWFAGPFVDFFKSAWSGIQKAFQAAVDFIRPVIDFFVSLFESAVNQFKRIWGVVAPVVESAFNLVVSIIKLAVSIISAIFTVIYTVVKAVFDFIAPYVKAALDKVVAVVTFVWNLLKIATSATWDFIKGAITSVWEFLKPYVETAVNAISAVVTKVWDFIKAVTQTAWDAIKFTFTTVWDAIVGIFKGAVDRVSSIFDGFTKIFDRVRGFFDGLKKAADGGVGELISFVMQVPNKVIDAIGGLGSLLWSKGRDLVQGLIDGVKSMFSRVSGVAKDLVSKITDWLPGSPAKRGPLSGHGYVRLRGERAAEDFATGISTNSGSAQDAVAAMVADMATALPRDASINVNQAIQTSTVARGAVATLPAPSGQLPPAEQRGNVYINNLALKGVWDFTDPGATRKMVGTLNTELDNYRKGYK